MDALARPGGMLTNLEASSAKKHWAHPETGVLHTFQHEVSFERVTLGRSFSRDVIKRSRSDDINLVVQMWGGQDCRLTSRDSTYNDDFMLTK